MVFGLLGGKVDIEYDDGDKGTDGLAWRCRDCKSERCGESGCELEREREGAGGAE